MPQNAGFMHVEPRSPIPSGMTGVKSRQTTNGNTSGRLNEINTKKTSGTQTPTRKISSSPTQGSKDVNHSDSDKTTKKPDAKSKSKSPYSGDHDQDHNQLQDDRRGSFWKTILLMLPLFTILPWYCVKKHYELPEPVLDGSPQGQPPVVSETNIIAHVQALEDIGYRTVGTQEAVEGEIYVYEYVKEIERRCNENGVMECQVWWQQGDGLHQFDIMGHAVLKSYQGVSNIILRVADKNSTTAIDGTPIQDAILLNAHIDSALPSPGAADDGIGVGVMLDCARVLVDRNESIAGAAIFLFNGAEETLQDASHLYSTQHETRDSVKTVINLEAAGSTGAALLFQATSKEMIQAYGSVPRPHTTVVAADVFSSGIILSDTDFVQFEKYLGVSGLDMAIVGHSYFYHTRKDRVEFITPGSAQHFAETTMAVLDYLLRPGSSLVTDSPWSPPDLIYYSLYDSIYISYSLDIANYLHGFTAVAFIIIFAVRMDWSHPGVYAKAIAGSFGSLLLGISSAIYIAGVMRHLFQKGQSWFTHEHLPMILYGLPSVTGSLAFQFCLFKNTDPSLGRVIEHASAWGALGFSTILMAIFQLFRIRSGFLFFNFAFTGFSLLAASEAIALLRNKPSHVNFFFGYYLWTAISIFFATEGITNFLDIFVPLTGRMGKEAPTEMIIATISSVCSFLFFPTIVPFFHKWNRKTQRNILITFFIASLVTIAVFASPILSAYDDMHPKRLGVQYMYNVTSGEQTLHVAQLDSGPGFQKILHAIHDKYGSANFDPVACAVSETNNDWDVLYPVSAFIEAEKFQVETIDIAEGQTLPEVQMEVLEDSWDQFTRQRTLALNVKYPGLIYPDLPTGKLNIVTPHPCPLFRNPPALAFSAEIIEWDFLSAPPVGRNRHYVKSASAPGREEFNVTMTLVCEDEPETLDVHWVGIDLRQMFPATAVHLGADLPASRMFVEMDAWMEREWNGSLDVLMIGAIGGVQSL